MRGHTLANTLLRMCMLRQAYGFGTAPTFPTDALGQLCGECTSLRQTLKALFKSHCPDQLSYICVSEIKQSDLNVLTTKK